MPQKNSKRDVCFMFHSLRRETVKQKPILCNTLRNTSETVSLKALAENYFSETRTETKMKQELKNSETKHPKNASFVSLKKSLVSPRKALSLEGLKCRQCVNFEYKTSKCALTGEIKSHKDNCLNYCDSLGGVYASRRN